MRGADTQVTVFDANGQDVAQAVAPREALYRVDFSKCHDIADIKAALTVMDFHIGLFPDTAEGKAVLDSAGGAFLVEVPT